MLSGHRTFCFSSCLSVTKHGCGSHWGGFHGYTLTLQKLACCASSLSSVPEATMSCRPLNPRGLQRTPPCWTFSVTASLCVCVHCACANAFIHYHNWFNKGFVVRVCEEGFLNLGSTLKTLGLETAPLTETLRVTVSLQESGKSFHSFKVLQQRFSGT